MLRAKAAADSPPEAFTSCSSSWSVKLSMIRLRLCASTGRGFAPDRGRAPPHLLTFATLTPYLNACNVLGGRRGIWSNPLFLTSVHTLLRFRPPALGRPLDNAATAGADVAHDAFGDRASGMVCKRAHPGDRASRRALRRGVPRAGAGRSLNQPRAREARDDRDGRAAHLL